MIFIDANIFIAFDNTNDIHHSHAKEIFRKIDEGTYGEPITSDYVFNEVVGVVFRKLGKGRSVTVGDFILSSIILIPVNDHLLKESWNRFKNSHLHLNLVDCSNLLVMEATKTRDIATFDKEF